MISNNNQHIIKKLASREFKAGKKRNRVAITAIVLTTTLFCSFFTIGGGMIKSFEMDRMRMIGTTTQGAFKYLDREKMESIVQAPEIKEYGIDLIVGEPLNAELQKRITEIHYYDENCFKWSFVLPLLKGKIPEKENEILVDTIVLDMLGIPHVIGETVTLEYRLYGEDIEKDFKISGIYKGDKVQAASLFYVSKAFTDRYIISGKDDPDSIYTGKYNLAVNLVSKRDIGKTLKDISKRYNHNPEDIGINSASIWETLSLDFQTTMIIILFLFIIFSAGYTLIYNIFYIDIIKNIRYYGLLKSLGATSGQIRSLIFRQVTCLSIISIPIGIVIGAVLGFALIPLVLSSTTAANSYISLNPLIFIFSAMFSFTTVIISSIKPLGKAGKISPVEAIRYNGINVKKRESNRNNKPASLFLMAFRNLKRSGKKAFLVIISLFLSIILFSTIFLIIKGFDINLFLQQMINSDFTIADATFYGVDFPKYNRMKDENINYLESLEGIKSVNWINKYSLSVEKKETGIDFTPLDEEIIQMGGYVSQSFIYDIYGLQNRTIQELKPYIVKGSIDNELFNSGNYIIIERYFSINDIVEIGDRINMPSLSGEEKSYTVMAILEDIPMYLRKGSFSTNEIKVYLPTEELANFTESPGKMISHINVNPGYVKSVEKEIIKLTTMNPSLDFRSRDTFIKEFKSAINAFLIVGYSLAAILAIIALINFYNLMTSNILSRKHELALLQSVGMTTRQVKTMLMYEGGLYTLFTFILTLMPGTIITKAILMLFSSSSFAFSIIPYLFIFPVLTLLTVFTPIICLKKINSLTVVERLREAV